MERMDVLRKPGADAAGHPAGRRAALLPALAIVAVAVSCGAAPSFAAGATPYRRGVVLLAFKPGVSAARQRAIERGAGGTQAHALGPAIRPVAGHRQPPQPLLLRLGRGTVAGAVAWLRGRREVAYAEPDYIMHAAAVPSDPASPSLWADENTGQPIPAQEQEERLGPPSPGTPGADDGAHAAWDLTTGSRSIVVGVVDSGIDYDHPDLGANVWTNPGGIFGCAAGTRGYDVIDHTCNPEDQDTSYAGHGTHVAGIVGAVGNNGIGTTGINWQTTILAVRWLRDAGSGATSDLIEALRTVVQAKQSGVRVRVVNDSATFVGSAYSQALSDQIDTLGANDILFVTAAGNTGDDNDEVSARRYPCGYDRPTEICVTASDNNDQLASWANYGPHTVDLAAPGVSIYSTLRESRYGFLSGGSMASPQVAGAAALILSTRPALSTAQVRAAILQGTDSLPSLQGKLITGGRLDVCKALAIASGQPCPPAPPAPPAAPQPAGEVQNFTVPRPALGRLGVSPRVFAPARRGPAVLSAKARGATVTYTDSQPSRTRFEVLALRAGVRDGRGRCIPPVRRLGSVARPPQPCVRYTRAGVFARSDRRGANRFRLSGRLNGRALAPGRYHLRAVATFQAVSGPAVSAAFGVTR